MTQSPKGGKIDIANVPAKIGTLYPPPHHINTKAREKRALGEAVGLNQFGVNITRLGPNTWSALPHWHEREDEFVYVIEGHPTLIYGDTEEQLAPGDCAGFKAGIEVGHCLQNRTDKDVVILEVGSRITAERAFYPGLDLMVDTASPHFYHHLDGTPCKDVKRRGPNDD
ncbi:MULTISPECIES: cupin domain-containing protein [Pacificibacter]|uniref:cupin domain-containing protein n=1 Tax=Pacificibacter TaxID=1042323 RepID=UPI001C08E9A6|nr:MULTISPECIES: cupin domain-containing protein [Pacificibacter]MBU2934485.1 cupin domain-containing protein [Pacificibacter marinus]MDO6617193.1 cupin domain-containing protein [Pacificibacter sp. 1_MG-2023]